MPHVRQQVRDAVKTLLTGITGVKTVSGIRLHPFNTAELPAIQVVTASETSALMHSDPVETRRDIQVDVSVWALGNDGIDDTLDDIAAQVETRILTATGGIWDQGSGVYMVEPTGATLNRGDPAEETAMVLTTRFRVVLQASTPETIGD